MTVKYSNFYQNNNRHEIQFKIQKPKRPKWTAPKAGSCFTIYLKRSERKLFLDFLHFTATYSFFVFFENSVHFLSFAWQLIQPDLMYIFAEKFECRMRLANMSCKNEFACLLYSWMKHNINIWAPYTRYFGRSNEWAQKNIY